jgi:uncharacterized protein YecE (DUF72 family)
MLRGASPRRGRLVQKVRIGASSWTSDTWWGRVYPKSLADAERLGWYARRYDTVEVDSTYYRPPPATMVSSWARRTPPGFRFSVKMFRDYLDPKKPVAPEKLGAFTHVARRLGEKLGPILLQFSPWVTPGRAEGFLRETLSALEPGLSYAVELRDAGWYRGETFERLLAQLRDRNVALAWSYLTYVDVPAEVTSNYLYVRFIGDHTTVPEERHGEVRVDRSAVLEAWAERVRSRLNTVEQAFVYFNNHFQGFAPASVNAFREWMGMSPVRYAPERLESFDRGAGG